MDQTYTRRGDRYRRVCGHLFRENVPKAVEAQSLVTRHSFASRPSGSSLRELPQVLGPPESPKRSPKPRRTLRSRSTASIAKEAAKNRDKIGSGVNLSSALRSGNSGYVSRAGLDKDCLKGVGRSAPCVRTESEEWADIHIEQCMSSRSHTRLKEIQDEIRTFRDNSRWSELSGKLKSRCGIELDQDGNLLPPQTPKDGSSEKYARHVELGAAVSDEQMKRDAARAAAASSVYPIDRYLNLHPPQVDISSLLRGDDWNIDPAMKPEDELMLQRLHNMLQSTADDLRELSSHIARNQRPAYQIRSRPMLLDEEFNEKVHLKEMVDAKLNGRVLVDGDNGDRTYVINEKKIKAPQTKPQVNAAKESKVNAGVQVNLVPKTLVKKADVPQANIKIKQAKKSDKIQPDKVNSTPNPPKILIVYEEHKNEVTEPIMNTATQKLVIQEMPSVAIRSELREQKLVSLNISPNAADNKASEVPKNSAVIEIIHNNVESPELKTPSQSKPSQESIIRKVVKLPACESSDSLVKSNSESETKPGKAALKMQTTSKQKVSKLEADKPTRATKKSRTHDKARLVTKSTDVPKKQMNTGGGGPRLGSEGWKKKLDSIYGTPSTPKSRILKSQCTPRKLESLKKLKPHFNENNILNNAEYVPYSKLTLGGVNVSDIENELACVTSKADLPLSPILDKILSSKENSRQDSPRQVKNDIHGRPFTVSDENLMKEVIAIDKTIKKTLNKDAKNLKPSTSKHKDAPVDDIDNNNSYSDDFDDEDEMSEHTVKRSDVNSNSYKLKSDSPSLNSDVDSIEVDAMPNPDQIIVPEKNKNSDDKKKSASLSQKTIDVFEFVHSVDTQETATQSQRIEKISLKETQTSPRNEGGSQPIHNELWTSAFDTSGEVDKMFQAEKDFIRNLIIEEYGDVFELSKNISKATVTLSGNDSNNIASHPKDTQTSPSRVKSVMTSPCKTNTKTTSPFHRPQLSVQRQACPQVVANIVEYAAKSESEDELAISVNLSSPRFNLRLPQSSRDVLSNLDSAGPSSSIPDLKSKVKFSRKPPSSGSSASWYETESDVSLGQVNWKRRSELRRTRRRNCTASESSATSINPSSGDATDNLMPTKSEGEISLYQM